MKFIEKKITYAESFGNDAYNASTTYTCKTSQGDIISESISGEHNDEECINSAKKTLITRLLDSCCGLLELPTDYFITIGGEDGQPREVQLCELNFYDIESYEVKTQIKNRLLNEYSDNLETIYHKIWPLYNNEKYEEFFFSPDYYYSRGISLLEYSRQIDAGKEIPPINLKRVKLRDDFKSAFEVTGGIGGYAERMKVAKEKVEKSIYDEELLIKNGKIYIVRMN